MKAMAAYSPAVGALQLCVLDPAWGAGVHGIGIKSLVAAHPAQHNTQQHSARTFQIQNTAF
jgi:hypothetical protein